jgi:hypothetical protein
MPADSAFLVLSVGPLPVQKLGTLRLYRREWLAGWLVRLGQICYGSSISFLVFLGDLEFFLILTRNAFFSFFSGLSGTLKSPAPEAIALTIAVQDEMV